MLHCSNILPIMLNNFPTMLKLCLFYGKFLSTLYFDDWHVVFYNAELQRQLPCWLAEQNSFPADTSPSPQKIILLSVQH